MSVWKSDDEFFNSDEELRLNHEEFEQWLDSIEGDGTDQEKYDREMAKQAEYPEVVIQSPKYTMTYSNN